MRSRDGSVLTICLSVLCLFLSAVIQPAFAGEPARVDSGLGAYKATDGIAGNLSSMGSDTLNNLMTLWGESFQRHYPSVRVQVEGKGSSTAPPALIEGAAQFGPMSRAMKNTEIDAFEDRFGYKPTSIRVAVDALAVFVHKDNPLQQVTFEQLDAIFSKTRRLGAAEDITTWGDLGLTGEWANQPINLYGRNSASGTYGFFKELVLGNGDYKDEVKEQPGSASVVQSISVDRFAIGYSGIGYKTAGVRALPIVNDQGKTAPATAEAAYSGDYPLSRFLYVYINKHPNQALDQVVKEYLKLVLSKEGQEIVVRDGYYPLTAELAKEELAKIE